MQKKVYAKVECNLNCKRIGERFGINLHTLSTICFRTTGFALIIDFDLTPPAPAYVNVYECSIETDRDFVQRKLPYWSFITQSTATAVGRRRDVASFFFLLRWILCIHNLRCVSMLRRLAMLFSHIQISLHWSTLWLAKDYALFLLALDEEKKVDLVGETWKIKIVGSIEFLTVCRRGLFLLHQSRRRHHIDGRERALYKQRQIHTPSSCAFLLLLLFWWYKKKKCLWKTAVDL